MFAIYSFGYLYSFRCISSSFSHSKYDFQTKYHDYPRIPSTSPLFLPPPLGTFFTPLPMELLSGITARCFQHHAARKIEKEIQLYLNKFVSYVAVGYPARYRYLWAHLEFEQNTYWFVLSSGSYINYKIESQQ